MADRRQAKTILFVHGTGVRRESYDRRFADVAAGLAAIRPDWPVTRCYWGDKHGSRLHADGVTVPVTSTRGFSETEEDPKVALWWALEADPLFEIRLLAAADVDSTLDLPPSAIPPGERLARAAQSLPDTECASPMAEVGLAAVFPEAIDAILADAACDEMLFRAAKFGSEVAQPLARAIVAEAIAAAERAGETVVLDGDSRDELVRAVVDALGASGRGAVATVGGFVAKLGMHVGGNRIIDRRRAAWSAAAAPMAGDVLVYLARGGGIRDFIAARLTEIDGPTIILAHSLGGIAALELLITQSFPHVVQLVTVGSQGPLLYELDALPTLRFGEELPVGIPPWVNIYDTRDLLGYSAAGIFPGQVEDRVVDNRAPFLGAHSAYFFRKNRRFYELLDEVLV